MVNERPHRCGETYPHKFVEQQPPLDIQLGGEVARVELKVRRQWKATTAFAAAALTVMAAMPLAQSDAGASTRANKSPYVIGAIFVLSGPAAFVGQEAEEGMQIAIKDINAKGGINGHPLKAVYLDCGLVATTAVTDLAKLKSEGVKFLVTQASPIVAALKPLVYQDKILTINQAATDPTIADAGEYMFTNIATANTEAKSLVGYIKAKTNVKSIGFLVDSTSIGESAQAGMEKYMKKAGIAVAGTQTYAEGTTDFSSQLVALKAANPDAIFMDDTGPSVTVNILQEAKSLGITVPFFSNTFFNAPTLPSMAGSLINGVTFDEVGFNPHLNAVASRLQTQYHKAGYKGVAPIYTATAFDAVGIMANAMKEVGYNSVAAREKIVTLKNYVGATGLLQFNKAGQVSMPVEIDQVRNDQYVTIEK